MLAVFPGACAVYCVKPGWVESNPLVWYMLRMYGHASDVCLSLWAGDVLQQLHAASDRDCSSCMAQVMWNLSGLQAAGSSRAAAVVALALLLGARSAW